MGCCCATPLYDDVPSVVGFSTPLPPNFKEMAICKSKAECTATCVVVNVPHERGQPAVLGIANGALNSTVVRSIASQKRLVIVHRGNACLAHSRQRFIRSSTCGIAGSAVAVIDKGVMGHDPSTVSGPYVVSVEDGYIITAKKDGKLIGQFAGTLGGGGGMMAMMTQALNGAQAGQPNAQSEYTTLGAGQPNAQSGFTTVGGGMGGMGGMNMRMGMANEFGLRLDANLTELEMAEVVATLVASSMLERKIPGLANK